MFFNTVLVSSVGVEETEEPGKSSAVAEAPCEGGEECISPPGTCSSHFLETYGRIEREASLMKAKQSQTCRSVPMQ